MTEYSLIEKAPLDHVDVDTVGARLTEETGLAILAMTTGNGKSRAMMTAFKKHFSCPPPAGTETIVAGSGNQQIKFMASALDQVFVIAHQAPADLEEKLKSNFGHCASLTDQSDGWAVLTLTGERAHDTLERLSMVDLSPPSFDIGHVARTVFEHINVIVMRDKPKRGENLRYMILTPRSSAEDLCHALLESPPFRE